MKRIFILLYQNKSTIFSIQVPLRFCPCVEDWVGLSNIINDVSTLPSKPPCCIYEWCVWFENHQLDQIMDLEKAFIIHRNSSFTRGRFWLEIWHVRAFWCAQSRFVEGLSQVHGFEREEEGGWLACLWLRVQIIWGLWKGCGLWSRKELDTMDGWWIPTYRQVCSIIFWLNVIKAVLKSSFVDVILLLLWMEVSSAICFRNISLGFALYTRVKEIEVLYIFTERKECKDDR